MASSNCGSNILKENYLMKHQVAKGNFGIVYKVKKKKTKKSKSEFFALKRVRYLLNTKEKYLNLFLF